MRCDIDCAQFSRPTSAKRQGCFCFHHTGDCSCTTASLSLGQTAQPITAVHEPQCQRATPSVGPFLERHTVALLEQPTLAVTRQGITGKLKLTLQSTNQCESMISTVRVIHRNVKHWSSGDMCLRWTAAGMLEAETRFRKVEGYRGLANLAVKIDRTSSVSVNLTVNISRGGDRSTSYVTIPTWAAATVNFHDERDNLLLRPESWPGICKHLMRVRGNEQAARGSGCLSPPFRTARASLAGCRCWIARER